jgi:C4-dicarboxylate transporter DctQ subunit
MVLNILNRVTMVVAVLFLSVITVMVAVEVVLRYCFGSSLYVTEELTRYLMVWVVFLASSLAVRDNAHISIEILANLFKGRARAWYNLVAQLFFLSFLAFLMIEGLIALPFQTDQIIPTLNIAISWFYLAIPVGSALMILNLLPRVWDNLKTIAGKAGPVEQPEAAPAAERGLL